MQFAVLARKPKTTIRFETKRNVYGNLLNTCKCKLFKKFPNNSFIVNNEAAVPLRTIEDNIINLTKSDKPR